MVQSLANRSQFTFAGVKFLATSVSVQGPSPEIADMSTFDSNLVKLVPTGSYTSPGRIDVECLGFVDPLSIIGETGEVVFTTPAGAIARNVICESASSDAQVGDVLRMRMSFVPTDYVDE